MGKRMSGRFRHEVEMAGRQRVMASIINCRFSLPEKSDWGGSHRSFANLWGFGDTIEIASSNGKIRNRMERSRYTTEMVPHSWR